MQHNLACSPALQRLAAPAGLLVRGSRRRGRLVCRAASEQHQIRRLVLMRHAESEERRGVRDHDRAITELGAATARKVAEQLQQLADSGWTPQVVVCSNARRTRQTLDVMAAAWPALAEADSHFLGSLYTTAALDGQTRGHLSDIVAAEAAAEHSCCLCLGHNKGWEEAASSFAGEAVKLGNSCAALLEGRGASWADALAADSQWRLVRLVSPDA
ncbi:phosphoglycerate mutase [Chlorella sorokiniana]|uniref:Phosphoglycerate mutase n=1 Tax=Chlorella sorokiniana TaxID=3076 RepID=A0A2P6TUT4_CHLSO|nr:phosphoglycerate mutase [Chlorella sorokiniana]|eukprot:PRW57804.1 phosphoglycerate mutase [Chlorella sorokiniana]